MPTGNNLKFTHGNFSIRVYMLHGYKALLQRSKHQATAKISTTKISKCQLRMFAVNIFAVAPYSGSTHFLLVWPGLF